MAIVNVEADASGLAAATASRIASLLRDACQRHGTAHICLTGGQTPHHTYDRLVHASQGAGALDWNRVHLFWGDERAVPPDHEDSNFGMADRALILPAAIPSRNIHRMRGELPDAEQAARDYERVLKRFERAGAPRFDVMLLGLGTDGHIASLFPGSPLLAPQNDPVPRDDKQEADERGRLAAAVWVPALQTWRITLTPRALLDAGVILVLTAGAAKADAVHIALRLPEDIARWPVQLLRRADDRVEWWLDRAAAAAL
jgi:6-phosphogluconolactonase